MDCGGNELVKGYRLEKKTTIRLQLQSFFQMKFQIELDYVVVFLAINGLLSQIGNLFNYFIFRKKRGIAQIHFLSIVFFDTIKLTRWVYESYNEISDRSR